jgi:hypothetical protein
VLFRSQQRADEDVFDHFYSAYRKQDDGLISNWGVFPSIASTLPFYTPSGTPAAYPDSMAKGMTRPVCPPPCSILHATVVVRSGTLE